MPVTRDEQSEQVSRRGALLAGLATSMAVVACTKQAQDEGGERVSGNTKEAQTVVKDHILLWPDGAPGGENVTITQDEIPRSESGPVTDTAFINITAPFLIPVLPVGRPIKSAMLLVPGGGYRRVAVGHGAHDIARYFAQQGIAVFVLVYRLPQHGWAAGADVSVDDAQRGLKLAMSEVRKAGMTSDVMNVIGFSAGGNVAGRLANLTAMPTYKTVDEVDNLPVKLKTSALISSVTLTVHEKAHRGSVENLRRGLAEGDDIERLSVVNGISENTPPTFLCHAIDDNVVPLENALEMLNALRLHDGECAFHAFQTGAHGIGLHTPNGEVHPWLKLYEHWTSLQE